MWMHVHMDACTHGCVNVEVNAVCLPLSFSTCLLRQGCLLNPVLPDWLYWLPLILFTVGEAGLKRDHGDLAESVSILLCWGYNRPQPDPTFYIGSGDRGQSLMLAQLTLYRLSQPSCPRES